MSTTDTSGLTPDGEVKTPQERHDQRIAWMLEEAHAQGANRRLAALCEAMYDNEQWEPDEAADVEGRDQQVVVYNEVAPTIDVLIGTERRNRMDFSVVADDDDDESERDAENKTRLLKWNEEVNKTRFERSEAFGDTLRAGVGWIEVSIRGDRSGPVVYSGHESWRNILHDRRARPDLTDARYLFRFRIVDLDIAKAMFPDKTKELDAVAQRGDDVNSFRSELGLEDLITGVSDLEGRREEGWGWMATRESDSALFNPRPRVLLIEAWTREPVRRKLSDPSLGDPIQMRVRVSIMTEQATLMEMWSPYRHDRFPFVPIWAYRNRRTGLPYSPIVRLIGPQRALNKRMTKALWEASANQVEIQEDAVGSAMDLEELRAEWNAPDGVAVLASGALSGGKVRTRQNEGRAKAQLELADRDIMHIQRSSGVNEESRGLKSSATSKVAMDAKFERGSIATTQLFDQLSMAHQMEGELVLSMSEQYMTHPMTVRVSADNGKYSRIKLNQPGPDGRIINDISARQAHFVVGEQPWKQSYAESAFASLMEVMSNLGSVAPNVVIALLDVLFDMHPHLPKKSLILERIRQVNGQQEPGARPTPEQQAKQAQQAAIAKAQFEAQMAQMMASVREAEAKGAKLETEAMRNRLTALYEAAQAAQVLAQVPGVTPIADELLKSAGFQDLGGAPGVAGSAAVPAQQPQPEFPDLQQADGLAAGIQTPAPDGVIDQGTMQ